MSKFWNKLKSKASEIISKPKKWEEHVEKGLHIPSINDIKNKSLSDIKGINPMGGLQNVFEVIPDALKSITHLTGNELPELAKMSESIMKEVPTLITTSEELIKTAVEVANDLVAILPELLKDADHLLKFLVTGLSNSIQFFNDYPYMTYVCMTIISVGWFMKDNPWFNRGRY